MKIEIETGEMSIADAAGLIALLGLMFPAALETLEAAGIRVEERVGDISRTVSGDPEAVSAFLAEPTAERVFAAAPAPDAEGQPFTEAKASEASGGAAEVAAPPPPPTVPAAAAPAGGNSAELDADGIPWDARIHSEGHARTKTDNKWRLKRGVADEVRAKVIAELKAAMAASPPASAAAGAPTVAAPPPPPAPVTTALVAEPAPSPPSPPVVEAAAPPPPPAETPAPPAPVVVDAAVSPAQAFGAIMRKVAEAQGAGKITAADCTTAAVSVGLASVRDLLARPDLIPDFEAVFDGLVAAA